MPQKHLQTEPYVRSEPRLPVGWVLAGLLCCASAAGVGGAVFISQTAGWVIGGSLAVASLAGAGVTAIVGSLPGVLWSMPVLAGQVVRLGVSTACALGGYLLAEPDRVPFWAVFLGGSFVSLAAEVAAVAVWARRANHAAPEPPGERIRQQGSAA